MGELISLVEYAKRHEKNRVTVAHRAAAGDFETAKKIGKIWVIDEDEPYPDKRVKSGKYRNWRKT